MGHVNTKANESLALQSYDALSTQKADCYNCCWQI